MKKSFISKIIDSVEILTLKERNYYLGDMTLQVQELLARRHEFLALPKKYKTPFYIYDSKLHKNSIKEFKNTFTKHIPDIEIYYSMKLNHHPLMIKEAIMNEIGIEVASVRELKIAKKFNSKKILYYAPGKSEEDLEFIANNSNNLLLNIDSFNELRKLGQITNKLKKHIYVGVRINLPIHGAWTKYGIQLKKLSEFWIESKKYKFIELQGIHFHTSRNKDATVYVKSIQSVAAYLRKYFSGEMLNEIKYLDFGGGFDTNLKEGIHSWETGLGKLRMLVGRTLGQKVKFKNNYLLLKNSNLEGYAKDIGKAIDKYMRPIVKAKYITEPGRVLCNDGMHIVVRVADIKGRKSIIADGGVNLVGWQRFEHEYFPIINLSHPSLVERSCIVYGNLCTTWDLWGYYVYTSNLIEGDILLIPYQGALTYTLAQNFINPIANVYRT